MNEVLSGKDWHTLLSSSSIKGNWSAFKNLLSNLEDRFIPTVRITQSQFGVPWWSNALSKAVAKNIVFTIGIYIPCPLMIFRYMPNKGI